MSFNVSSSNSSIEQEFQHSLKRFKARLSSAERDRFQYATLDDLRRALLYVQNKQAAKSKAMHLPRVLGFLEGFKQIGEVVEVFVNSSEFVAFIWGPMKFLIQVASTFAEAFDTLLSAYEQIGEAMPLVKQYRELFHGNAHMEEALARIYDDILEFHSRALRFFTLPTWQQFFRSVWKSFDSKFGSILQDLRRHKSLIESQASVIHFQQYQADRQVMLTKLDELETTSKQRKYTELIQWVAGADCLLDHEDVCKVRDGYPRSGLWLLRHGTYLAWRSDSVPREPILRLHGIPGAGKTVLASLVIEDCKKESKATTAYFYCKHGDPLRTTCIGILKALLGQLINHDSRLLPWLYDEYLVSGQLSLTSYELCKKLIKAVLLSTERVFLVIDGLDECEAKEVKSLLAILSELMNACEAQEPGKLRTVIVSQDVHDVRRGIAMSSEIALKQSDNHADIESFVDSWCKKIQAKFDLEDHERDAISQITCDRAEGMFLFAKLIMTHLYNQVSAQDLETEIQPDKFPRGLNQVYDRIIDRIGQGPSEQCSVARVTLGWMTCARRPLKWHEMQGMFAVDAQRATVDFVQRKLRLHFRELCGSLVNQLSGDRIELVHNTTKHYLINCEFVMPAMIECRLAATCLSYLTFECFDVDLLDDAYRDFLLEGYYAFQDYAATHWSDHLLTVVDNGPDVPRLSFEQIEPELSTGLADFVAKYGLSTNQNDSDGIPPKCINFEKYDCFEDLCHTVRHILRHKMSGIDGLDFIRPQPLDQIINDVRSRLEKLANCTALPPATRVNLISFYGPQWFKCPKATCFYFHEGFADENARKVHILRHETPFRCPFENCDTGYKLGFARQKDLDKHMVFYHPETRKMMLSFSRPRRARASDKDSGRLAPSVTKHPTKFECDKCGKKFTRAAILQSHRLGHEDAKPFNCRTCNKAFLRDYDRKRHEQTHTDEKKFVCQGQTRYTLPPRTWGCGKVFSRPDALNNHLRSAAGKECRAVQDEDERFQSQWKQQQVIWKDRGWKLPVPSELLARHPEFQALELNQLIGQLEKADQLELSGIDDGRVSSESESES